jgi:hypothetical protein
MKQEIKHGAILDALTLDELRGLVGRDKGFSGIYDVVAGDFQGPEPVLLTNPPVRRLRVTRSGIGAEAVAVAAGVASQVLLSNEGRLGGQITNRGASPVFIYLSNAADLTVGEQHNRPTLWLTPGGGSWDFTISGIVWGGSVWAAGDGGATNLTLTEL